MKNAVTVSVIRMENKIYRASFPEYEDCPEAADDNLEDLILFLPAYLSVYMLLSGNEFIRHIQPLTSYIKATKDRFCVLIYCDMKLTADMLSDLEITPDAFFMYISEKTGSFGSAAGDNGTGKSGKSGADDEKATGVRGKIRNDKKKSDKNVNYVNALEDETDSGSEEDGSEPDDEPDVHAIQGKYNKKGKKLNGKQ